ncbi:unnamed protein product [Porites evermanni]|uniref:Uncharacterized protein n=1 Tax=Porites evermanni TaxID=104178 RepID=A0ABN8R977_9CNID|nr:unnamed protein product [Porites evermanni]
MKDQVEQLKRFGKTATAIVSPQSAHTIYLSNRCNFMMARYHSLEERKLPIACGDTPLKRVSYWAYTWTST